MTGVHPLRRKKHRRGKRGGKKKAKPEAVVPIVVPDPHVQSLRQRLARLSKGVP